MDNLVLIGMPSCGKSTAGKLLAAEIGFRFLDCDRLIEEEEGAPLPAIIEKRGTEGFLAVEERVNAGLNVHRCVIATGGSVCYCPRAMEHLKRIGLVVYLKIGEREAERRIPDFRARGVVMRGKVSTLAELYRERTPLYELYADATVDCSQMTAEETVAALMKLL